ncbi:MAG: hypothetical protein KAV18_06140, partial [Candidatus Omnitrophica bacterium]|nr:hypothetical protein [Candidatus Omnitrophota bacterium]
MDKYKNIIYFIVFLMVLITSLTLISNYDIWWHLKSGRIMLEQKRMLTSDIFSHTAYNKEWVNQAWLAQIIFYSIYCWQGVKALIFTKALIIGIIFTFICGFMIKRKTSLITALIFTLIAYNISFSFFMSRPLILGNLLLIIFFSFLYMFDITERPGYLFPLPLLSLIWANVH